LQSRRSIHLHCRECELAIKTLCLREWEFRKETYQVKVPSGLSTYSEEHAVAGLHEVPVEQQYPRFEEVPKVRVSQSVVCPI
jgi:hypothetical protein